MSAYALVLDSEGAELHWIPVDLTATVGLTFDLCPEYELGVRYVRRGLATPAAGGFVQRRTVWPEGDLRVFSLNWHNANQAEVARIKDIWRRQKASVKAMSWTPPDGTATQVKLANRPLRVAPRTPNAWAVELELEEVR